jgi:hypothetical protein
MRFLEEQLEELDNDIAEKIRSAGLDQQWQLLQTIPGIQERSAAKILAETGPDMTQFPSEKQISSWAGVFPGNNRSAGKNRSSHTTGGNPWLRGALTECSWAAAAKKDCFLKEKFWRLTTKSGGKKPPALVAVAHTVLCLVYQVLRTGQPYRERQASALPDTQKERLIRHHIRRLGKLGVRVHSNRQATETIASQQPNTAVQEPPIVGGKNINTSPATY